MRTFQRLIIRLAGLVLVMSITACQAAGTSPGPTTSPTAPQPTTSPSIEPSPAETMPAPAETIQETAIPTSTSEADQVEDATPQPAEPTPTDSPTAEAALRSVTNFPEPAAYEWGSYVGGFANPLLITHAGDGSGRLFVVEQPGVIWVVQNGERLLTPFLDIRSLVNDRGNEQGLLGLAFHPDFAQNQFFYVYYTSLSGDSVVARYRTLENQPDQANPVSMTPLMDIPQPYANHNGGHMAFGPDGYLYIGLGDGGSGGDPQNYAQNTSSLLGSLLRIEVGDFPPYSIPADNPFVNGGGQPEIWAYGLRNPWRFSFDRATGDLYMGDVGQNRWEEINYLPAGTLGGSNFGWRFFEGTYAFEGRHPNPSMLVYPIWEYANGGGNCSVTGGVVYRGQNLPDWQGVYLFGDYCSGMIWGLLPAADDITWQHRQLFDLDVYITSFGEDEAGEVYLVSRTGTIYQLTNQ